MAFLYLTQQGSVLRKSGDRFLVDKDARVILDLPYHKLEAVLVFGNVQVTTRALGELMDKGILVSFLTRQGRYRGGIQTPQGRDVRLRMAQFRACVGERTAPRLAAAVTEAKIANALEVLRNYHAGGAPEAVGFLAARREEAARAATLAELTGVEGAAAKGYFEALMRFNRSPFPWTGRKRFPAPDPLNALLSLAYTLLMTELCGLLEGIGLDAYLGFLHQPDYGRPSLALDLLEPFRHPVADRFVLTAVNRGEIRPGDFVAGPAGEGARLTPEALRRFLERWEGWLTADPPAREGRPAAKCFRRELRREVESLARAWRVGGEWRPWLWDHRQTPEEEACDSLSATT